jgi:endonuclease-3
MSKPDADCDLGSKSVKYPRKIRAGLITEKLKLMYPDADCTLIYREPYRLLISGILAAQCTDARVNIVVKNLFNDLPTIKSIADAPISDLEEYIRSCGFFHSKSKYIKESMNNLLNDFDGKVPETREELMTLPGVGRKIANLILGDCFGVQAIVVDTHCMRISKRLGLTESTDVLKIEQDLMRCVPKNEWTSFGHMIVLHGRALCMARSPKCTECDLRCLCKKGIESVG